jgi:hypothetical protein
VAIEEPSLPQKPLEWHLEVSLFDERDVRSPAVASAKLRQGKLNVFELDVSLGAHQLDGSTAMPCVADPHPEGLSCAVVEDCEGRAGVDERLSCPIPVRIELQAHIQQGARLGGSAVLAVRIALSAN